MLKIFTGKRYDIQKDQTHIVEGTAEYLAFIDAAIDKETGRAVPNNEVDDNGKYIGPVRYKGFEITTFENPEGVFYAQIKRSGGGGMTSGVTLGTHLLSGIPADTCVHAIEIGKSMVDTGQVK